MKYHCTPGMLGLPLAMGLIWPAALQAQITITASDMFNQPGQYYRAYANAPSDSGVNVNGKLGSVGGPQLWDFTTFGSSAVTYRFDYLSAAGAPHGTDFVTAGAQLAEQKTDEAGAVPQAWLYFTQHPALGRQAYGFYDPGFSSGVGASEAQHAFSPVLNDFPATIHFGDSWSSSTSFTDTLTFGDPEEGGVSLDLLYAYSSTVEVDAYGVANSPGDISFGDCLRVNELVRYDLSYDDGDGFQYLETDYVRNYYWLRPGRGIVAQVTSQQSSGIPPDSNFPTATSVVRMFETNHPDSGGPGTGGGIQGLKVTPGLNSALLSWTALASVTSYRVDYKPNLAAAWQPLGNTTTATYFIDTAAGKSPSSAPKRFYRVVGLP